MTVRKKKKDKPILLPYSDFIIKPCFEKYNLVIGEELMFDEIRKWRFDFYCFELMLAIEVEGIGGKQSRHTTIKGYIEDMEKYSQAAVLGWSILRFLPTQIRDMSYMQTLGTWLYYLENNNDRWYQRRVQGLTTLHYKSI